MSARMSASQMRPYYLGLYEKSMPAEISWSERLACARSCGFDYLELSIDESDARQARLDWTRAQRQELLHACDEEGIRFGSMCLSGHRKWPFGSHDESTRERSMTMMHKALELACDLGLHTIQLAGYDVYYEQGDETTKAFFAENLARAVELAAQYGVMLGFETMETPFMDTVEKAMHYVDLINNPYLGIYPDVGNLSNAALLYGHSVSDDVATGAGHIVAAHMKETVAGAYREIPFSTGTTDYAGALSQLVRQGVRRYVCEMWYVGQDCWEDDIRFANRYIRDMLDAVLPAYA